MKNRKIRQIKEDSGNLDCVLEWETARQERLRDIYDPEQGQPLQYTGKPESNNRD